MSNIIFEITNYEFLKDQIVTNITYKLSFNDLDVLYLLSIPSNPICEIDLLNLNKKDINKIIKKLISNKDYSHKTTEAIKKLYQWILKIIMK
tara:strand:+ start:68 stop:343 length:276 start_codon:yes stop_codon:yes gene_type:complete